MCLSNTFETYKPLSKELRNIKTIHDAIKTPSPTLGEMTRGLGEGKMVSLLFVYISFLNNNLNLTRGMNETQAKQCAEQIVYEFNQLRMADIHYIFKKANDGGYDLFEGISSAKILNWFRDHYNERSSIFGENSKSEHHYTKNHVGWDSNATRSSSKQTQSIAEIKATINSKDLKQLKNN